MLSPRGHLHGPQAFSLGHLYRLVGLIRLHLLIVLLKELAKRAQSLARVEGTLVVLLVMRLKDLVERDTERMSMVMAAEARESARAEVKMGAPDLRFL